MKKDEPFGGVSILAVGDFCQFKIFELNEIMQQIQIPIFASISNRVREAKQTSSDCDELEKLNETDTSNWSYKAVKLYPTNGLAGK